MRDIRSEQTKFYSFIECNGMTRHGNATQWDRLTLFYQTTLECSQSLFSHSFLFSSMNLRALALNHLIHAPLKRSCWRFCPFCPFSPNKNLIIKFSHCVLAPSWERVSVWKIYYVHKHIHGKQKKLNQMRSDAAHECTERIWCNAMHSVTLFVKVLKSLGRCLFFLLNRGYESF